MKKENYAELKTEELISKRKLLSVATGSLLGLLILLLLVAIPLMIKQGFTALIIIPFALSPILVLNFNQIAAISKEIKRRNTDQ